MNRVVFLVDGFNLYHSTRDLWKLEHLRAKWLNIHSLCSSFLYLIERDARLAGIYYFSAYACHLNDPNIIERHKNYVACLESTGIIPEMARFKPKQVTCPLGGVFWKHEEKETDIAIAARLFELLSADRCDTAVLLTGDTDLIPAVQMCTSLYTAKKVVFAFPYRRYSQEMALLFPGSFRIHAKAYARHLFPDSVRLKDGTEICRPPSW